MWLRRQWIMAVVGIVMVGVTWAQEESAASSEAPAGDATNATDTTTKPKLTGIPQIDYIHDPNLPHELRTYNLSDYPFYSRLPEDLLLPTFNFSCDHRHDGFYASVPHKCQVYHNCLFGQRYDFLCANFTVFDQKNFICHYVSEVDCANSALHYDRNEELYVTTTTTTSTPAPPQIIYVERPRPQRPGMTRPNRPRPLLGNRPHGNRRTTTTPAPVYYDDYYDEYYDQYYDDYYNDYANEKSTTTTTTTTQRPRRPNRPLRTRLSGGGGAGGGGEGRSRPAGRFGNIFNVGERKRPRINSPVPSDAEGEDESPRASRLQQNSGSRQQSIDDALVDEPPQDIAQEGPSGPPRGRPGRKPRPGGRPQKKTSTTTTTTTTETAPNDDYYYDYYDYENEPSTTAAPARPSRPSLSRTRSSSLSRPQQNRPQPTTTTTTTTTTEVPVTEPVRNRPSRPNKVNVRLNPAGDRGTPIEGAVPLDEPPIIGSFQATEPHRQRPQRLRPQFPRKRTQNEPDGEDLDAVVIQEDAPLAPGLEITSDGEPINTVALDSTSGPADEVPSGPTSGPRASLRRIGQSGLNRRPGPRVGGPLSRSTPDYHDY